MTDSSSPAARRVVLLWTLLAGHVAVWVAITALAPTPAAAALAAWVLLLLTIACATTVVLVTCGLPNLQGCVLAVGSAGVTLLGVAADGVTGWRLAVMPLATLCAAAACSAAMGRPGMAPWLRGGAAGSRRSLFVGVGTGLVLGAVNLALGLASHQHLHPAVTGGRLAAALSPATFEELACRAVLLAMCACLLPPAVRGRSATGAVWGLMTVPHLLPHLVGQAQQRGVGSVLVTAVVLWLLFSLPFAWLQRRRDLASAMVSHGVVDLVRFIGFGVG